MNTENRDIFILIESENGKPKESSLELFTAAMTVKAATGGSITAVALGDDTAEAVKQAAAYGADRIMRAEDERLGTYSTCRYTNAMYELIKKYSPDAVMISATPNGKDLAPRLARRLATGITANCTEISADGESGLISWNMPAPGGIMATILCEHSRPQMGTVCPGAFRKGVPDLSRTAEIIDEHIDTDADDGLQLLRSVLAPDSGELDIAAADIIVAGGRGMGSAENFELIRKLAKKLGAAVGASRAAVDLEWAEQKNLVGQTGKLVRPKLYIACGISGALQHVVGMRDAKCIIAINSDKDAPIFSIADYAIVGDAVDIISHLIEEF